MYVLGISETDNDAGVVLLQNSEVVCAINEERLSRIKRHSGFPYKSIDWVLQYSGLKIEDISHIAIAKANPKRNPESFFRIKKLLKNYDYLSKDDPVDFWSKILNLLYNKHKYISKTTKLAQKLSMEIEEWARQNNCQDKLIHIPHHYAHAASAYWASGYKRVLAITMDGQGEGVTSQAYFINKGSFELIKEILLPHSMGNFYAAVTKALGFKPARHEGKITGLAAYATPDKQLLEEVQKLAFNNAKGSFFAPSIYGSYPRIVKLAKKYGREQISSAFQNVLEEVVSNYISFYVEKYNIKNIVLAGGVFANVKLNMKIHEIPGIENIFIFPHMADGGLGYGAAQVVSREKRKDFTTKAIEDVYWGPEYSDDAIEKALKEFDISYSHKGNIEKDIAKLLAENKVIAHFHGRMEFGPRALGNRSILYPATDPKVNDWLNTRLHRSEFMPFAPVTIKEMEKECYIGTEGADFANQFMTITFKCTEQMKKQSPAVVHVDGTARPQIIKKEVNPRYYNIVKEYYNITGIPTIVNTSFNMHEEPIVCTPKDAIRSYLGGNLDYLAIGNFLVGNTNI